MRINLCFTEPVPVSEAEKFASRLQSPALVTDRKHIIRYRNKAAYRLPFLRCGAKLERFISEPCAESLINSPPGTLVVGGAENRRLPDIAALVCGDCVLVVLDALSAKLCGILRDEFCALPGYDLTLRTAADPFCGALKDKLGAETEKRFSMLISALSEHGAGSFRVFDAAKVIRPVISAADKLLGERGYSAFWHAVPTDLYTEGGEDGFAAIIAASLCACARVSRDGWVDVRGSADGRSARITVSASAGEEFVSSAAEGEFPADGMFGSGSLPDLYLARLIADANRWDLTVTSTPEEGSHRRISATLTFALCGSVTPADFILHEDLGDSIRSAMGMVFDGLKSRK
ncbi:MAG: hypothetical protein IJQ53_00360 [Clostridia bacterium]|nr:hypothetical protein [Clostridia bacterium]